MTYYKISFRKFMANCDHFYKPDQAKGNMTCIHDEVLQSGKLCAKCMEHNCPVLAKLEKVK